VQSAHAKILINQNLKTNTNKRGNFMSILNNLESYLDFLDKEPENLATKIFSETVCKECESKPMVERDNMGRDTSMYN
jgi:hypothetical protein